MNNDPANIQTYKELGSEKEVPSFQYLVYIHKADLIQHYMFTLI